MIIFSRLHAWSDRVTARWKGYRTKIFAWVAMIAPATALIVADRLAGFDWTLWFSPKLAPVVALGVAVIVLWLRSVTNTPSGVK